MRKLSKKIALGTNVFIYQEIELACGYYHSALVREKGEVYVNIRNVYIDFFLTSVGNELARD